MKTTHIDRMIAKLQKLIESDDYAKLFSEDKSRARRSVQRLESVKGTVAMIEVK